MLGFSRQRTVVLVLALGLLGCVSPVITSSPRSLDESIARARAQLHLGAPVEILRRRDGGDVLVVYRADAVVDGVGLVIVRADPPWDVQFMGTGEVSNEAMGGVGIAQSGHADGTSELIVLGVVADSRVRQLELDLGPDGTVDVPAAIPGFANVIPLAHEVTFPKWRFLDRDGSIIYDPYQ